MKFNFIDASNSEKFKATIHESGKLSFNVDSGQYMELNNKKHFKVAFEFDDGELDKIYLVESKETEITAKTYRSGPYFYLKLSKPLDNHHIEYKDKILHFLVQRSDEKYEDSIIFELTFHKSSEKKKL